jgi:hypothetical protein
MIRSAHCTEAAINLSVSGATTGSSEQVSRSSHVHRREDRGHDPEHALATFVHIAPRCQTYLKRQRHAQRFLHQEFMRRPANSILAVTIQPITGGSTFNALASDCYAPQSSGAATSQDGESFGVGSQVSVNGICTSVSGSGPTATLTTTLASSGSSVMHPAASAHHPHSNYLNSGQKYSLHRFFRLEKLAIDRLQNVLLLLGEGDNAGDLKATLGVA